MFRLRYLALAVICLALLAPACSSSIFTDECSGDTLKYTPPVTNAKPLTFKRAL